MRILNSTTANDLTSVSRELKKIMANNYYSVMQKFALLLLLCTFGTTLMSQNPCDGMKCNSLVNLSLDETCSAVITPGMFIENLEFPPGDYVLEAYDAHGNQVDLEFGIEDIDQTFEVKVFLPQCNNNSCWSYMTVEYKLPPSIDCPDDLTISCGGFDVLGLPSATATCAGLDFEVTLHNEVRNRLDCDPDLTHTIIRTYRVADVLGNEDFCTHQISLERVDLSNIMFPENRSVSTGNAISCNDPAFIFGENGVPIPWLFSNITASGSGYAGSGTSGVPFICDMDITDGVYCPLTGTGSGAPLIPMGGATDISYDGFPVIVPGEVNQVCNSVVLYTDVVIPTTGCITKVMRTWEVREWWCNGENERSQTQLIEVIDDEAPTFVCPQDFTVSTNDYCAAMVELPPVSPTDGCGNGYQVAIDFPKGYLNSNGGYADLEVGPNFVEYIVSDNCYNSSSCRINVTVRDNTEPVTICEQTTVVSISQSGTTTVYADSFDDGTWDECGLDYFAVRRMDTLCVAADTLFDESISFCCVDVGSEVMVVFRAYDLGGNYNDCMVTVEVQDKDIPLMVCPDDVTIDCREPYDLDNLGLVFGEPEIFDNCAAQQVVVEIVSADVNQCGIGDIVREFELRSLDSIYLLSKCKQRIDVENFTPFIAANIQWPLNYDTTGVCDYNISPEELPELYAFPKFLAGDDECSLLGWDYEDEVIETQNGLGECAFIQRTWSVINWCSQIEGRFEVFVIPEPQIIEIYNTVYPVIDPANDTIIESLNIDCESGLFELTRTATDDCDSLYWSYEVVDDQNVGIALGASNTYRDTLENGDYVIYWTVSDRCGNIHTDVQNLTVLNKKAAIPICINGFTVSLEAENQGNDIVYQAELWATDFDGGSYHPCENPIDFSLSSDTTDNNVVFTCEDVGVNMIQMWVTDVITGVQDYCATTIEVLAHPDCPPQMNIVNVRGEIYTEMLENVEGVNVDLDGGDIFDMTNTGGDYAFDNMPMGGNYTVIPSKDGDDLNGVSTLDLIMIQRHILGMEQLDSPYKLIAADVDGNDKISAIDLIELRKLILGMYNTFPNNTSWRFVDAGYNFIDPQDPWAFDIAEEYEIWNLDQDMDLDFIGVKIGDVNDSAIANTESIDNDTRDESKALNIVFEDISARKGEHVSVNVSSVNYNDIAGWQGTINFDASKLEISQIESATLDIVENENLNLASAQEGWMTISYSDPDLTSVDNNSTLFIIHAIAKEDISAEDSFELGSDITRAEAYKVDDTIVPLNITETLNSELKITSVVPNPWVDNAVINFEVPREDNMRFEFFDVNGKLLHVREKFYKQGKNQLKLNNSYFNSAGVIYVRISSNYANTEYKMLLIE